MLNVCSSLEFIVDKHTTFHFKSEQTRVPDWDQIYEQPNWSWWLCTNSNLLSKERKIRTVKLENTFLLTSNLHLTNFPKWVVLLQQQLRSATRFHLPTDLWTLELIFPHFHFVWSRVHIPNIYISIFWQQCSFSPFIHCKMTSRRMLSMNETMFADT